MPLPTRWRRHAKVFITYIMLVCFVEYLLLLRYEHSASRDFTEPSIVHLDQASRGLALPFPGSPGRTHANADPDPPVGNVSAAANELKKVSSETVDRTKLIMLQARLTTCFESNATNEQLQRCLEEEYLRVRSEAIKSAAQVSRDAMAHAHREQVVSNLSKNEALSQARLAARGLSEEENPGVAKAYYSRRSSKVNPYLYDYTVKPEADCDPETYMIILVHSFHPYAERRRAIRDTWGGVALSRHPWPGRTIARKIKFVFMLGIHHDEHQNDLLREEIKEYGDIVQGNFYDAYTNMTLKSQLGLKYVMETCPKAQILLKSDDDMFVNLPYLLHILESKNMSRSIMGPRNSGSKVYRTGKWKVTKAQFPFRTYPTYESGAAYVITRDLVRDLYETAEYVPPFHVDDVFLTGVIGRILNVNHEKQEGFAFWTDKALKVCDIITNVKITGTKMTPARLRKIWSDLHDVNLTKCPLAP